LWISVGAGCSRRYYRHQADCDAYRLIDCAANEAGMGMAGFSIEPKRASRMFDPNCPDSPPMPEDDPLSHRLMQCVDGKRGWRGWDQVKQTAFTENPDWQAYLSRNEDGQVVLDREGAVQMALLQSREYQRAMEELYLSALAVSFQRFRFDTQFFGGHSTFFSADGPARGGGPASTLALGNDLQAQRLLATGGELVVGMANSLVWQFAGPDGYSGNTLLDFSLVQPLLRAGGRHVALESLTDAERALLANIRQMQRFQRGFYAQIVTGRSDVSTPSRGGVGIGSVSRGGAASAGGYFALLEGQLRIDNQRANLVRLRRSLDRMEEYYRADRLARYQVGLTRQRFYQSQTDLLDENAGYDGRLDAYKITLGLPPELDIKIEDPLLSQFELIDPVFVEMQDTVTAYTTGLREQAEAGQIAPLAENLQRLRPVLETVIVQYEAVIADLDVLEKAIPARKESLQKLKARDEFRRGDIDPRVCDVDELDRRVASLYEDLRGTSDYVGVARRLTITLAELESFGRRPGDEPAPPHDPGERQQELIDLLDVLTGELVELSLIQAGARLDTVMLEPIEIEFATALEVARQNRRDWKNARAALVDAWRQVELAANELESGLDVTFSGDISTTDDNPLRFHSATGRLRAGLEFDAPLTRLAERNAYRETLINYQRSRREYYVVEDRIAGGFRDMIRSIRLNQLNFEVQRTAMFLSIDQVYQAQLSLEDPAQSKLADDTARNLLDALSTLLTDQNGFLRVWVNQEALRLNLDLDLGTMALDDRGMWVDPGPLDLTGPLVTNGLVETDGFVETDELPDEFPAIAFPEVASPEVAAPEKIPTPAAVPPEIPLP